MSNPITSRLLGCALTLALISTACGDSDDASPAEAVATTIAADVAGAAETSVLETTVEPTTASTTIAPTTIAVTTTTAAPERDFSAIDPIVSAFVDDRGLNGAALVIVDREAGIVHEDYWGVFNPDRVSYIASSSKMIAAGVLLKLQDDGMLDIDAPVADSVEWGAANPDITAAQLVSNSSGLVGLLQDFTYAPYICQWIPSGELQSCAETIFTSPDDDADIIAPDTDFHYGGGQWQVAGGLAEAVSGKSWSTLIEEIYIEPCGVTSLAFGSPSLSATTGLGFDRNSDQAAALEEVSNPNIEGGGRITPTDYAELLLMHLRGGFCGDAQVLSEEALDIMHTDRIAQAYDGDAYRPGAGYGMGWWIDRETGRITDGGAFGSHPWLDLEDGYGAFLVIEKDSGTGNELGNLLYAPVEAAMNGSS